MKLQNPIVLDIGAPFFPTPSRIFRNCGYAEKKLLPIDYLLYYYHLSQGPIYYHDEIMAAYVMGENSTFASLPSIPNLNSMFSYRVSLLFDFNHDQFCTKLQEEYDTRNGIGKLRYYFLKFLKKIFGIKLGWKIWFFIIFVPRYGIKCMDIHYLYSHKKAKDNADQRVNKSN